MPYSRLISLWTLLSLLFAGTGLSAQTNTNQNEEARGSNYARWTLRPVVYPYYPIQDGFRNEAGTLIMDAEGRGLEGFLRFARYRPGRHLSFGLDVGYSQQQSLLRHISNPGLSNASLTSGSLVFNPHVNFSWRGVTRRIHPHFSLGVSNRYEVDRSLRYNEAGSQTVTPRLITNLPFLKRNSLYWMVGAGMLRERVSISRRTNKPIELSVQAFLPFFNLANGVSTDTMDFADNPIANGFEELQRRNFHLGIIYTELINVMGNTAKLKEQEMSVLADSNEFRPLQPLFSGMQPHKSLEGVLSILAYRQPGGGRVDSNDVTGEEIIFFPSLGWKVGYTIHYYPNGHKYFDSRANHATGQGAVKRLFGVFAGVGITQQVYRFNSTIRYYDFLRTILTVEGGLSLGGSRGFMGFAGAGYRFSDNVNAIYDSLPPERFRQLQPIYGFVGVQIHSRIILRLETTPFEFLESVAYKPTQRVTTSIGVGF